MEQLVKALLIDDFWIMPPTPQYIKVGIPYITSKNIKNGEIDFNKVNYISQEAYENISKKRPILVGDILISMIGTLGETAVVKETDGIFYGQNMFLIRLDEKKINKKYFLYYFKSNTVKQILEGKRNQSTQKYLKANHIEDLAIPTPSLEKQRRIVELLDKIASIILLRKNEIKKLDEFINARFVEMFGDTKLAINKWGGKPFKEVTINLDSKRKPVKDADRKKMQGEYPYYGATGIVDYVNDYRQEGIFLLISEDGKALEFRNKPIAFIAAGKIWVNNHAHVQQCTDECNMIYLMYLINLMDISQWVTGIDQKKLNRENLDSIPIALPPIELQNQFEILVTQVDKSKEEVQKSLDEAQFLFDSLMQQYFG